MVAAIEQVVAEAYLQSGRTHPVVDMLALSEILGVAVPFVVLLLLVVVGGDGAEPLVWVVAGIEKSSLQTDVEPPVFGAV